MTIKKVDARAELVIFLDTDSRNSLCPVALEEILAVIGRLCNY